MADRNTELMKAMGSKSGRYDPEPPDHWKWQLEHGTPNDRFVAWVKSRTIALGHHSPYATDERGKAAYIEHVAADLGWALKTARNVAYAVHAEGRVRLDRKAKRIWLCAEVTPQEPISDAVDEEEDGRRLDEGFALIKGQLPPYVVDFITEMPRAKREPLLQEYLPFLKWQKDVFADAAAAVRAITGPIEDTILERHGIEKKRLPTRRSPITDAVQLTVKELPEFIQGQIDEAVEALHNVQEDTVQRQSAPGTNGLSLLSSDTDSDRESSSSEVVLDRGRATTMQTLPREADIGISELMQETGWNKKAAESLVCESRKINPRVMVRQIAAVFRQVVNEQRESLLSGEIKNSVGYLLKAVPSRIPEG